MPSPTDPTYRHAAGTNQYFRVLMRIRHAEPMFSQEAFIAHLADRVRWIATPVRAELQPGETRAWKAHRVDEAWTTSSDDETRMLGTGAGFALGMGIIPVVGGVPGALIGYLAARFSTDTDPVSPQWYVGLEGVVRVYQGGITNDELLRAIARAFADSVTWSGHRDRTITNANLPTHGGDLLRRMLDGSPDPHGIYARARVIVTASGHNEGPEELRRPVVTPDVPPPETPRRTPGARSAAPSKWALPIVIATSAVISVGAVLAYRSASGGG